MLSKQHGVRLFYKAPHLIPQMGVEGCLFEPKPKRAPLTQPLRRQGPPTPVPPVPSRPRVRPFLGVVSPIRHGFLRKRFFQTQRHDVRGEGLDRSHRLVQTPRHNEHQPSSVLFYCFSKRTVTLPFGRLNLAVRHETHSTIVLYEIGVAPKAQKRGQVHAADLGFEILSKACKVLSLRTTVAN